MDAAEIERLKDLLPTTLGGEDVRRAFAAGILRRSVLSARMAAVEHLAEIREAVALVLEGKISQGEARSRLLASLGRLGHDTAGDGSLADHGSKRRLDLIIDTQRQMAASAARIMSETPETLDEYPAWELARADSPRAPREDWPARWAAAGAAVGWAGAKSGVWRGDGFRVSFVALKSSPIWQALGDGAGGFRDTLGNPFPPFAFGSYMDWFDVDRSAAASLGLLGSTSRGAGASSPAGSRGAGASSPASLSPSDAELLEAARKVGWPGLFDDIMEGGE